MWCGAGSLHAQSCRLSVVHRTKLLPSITAACVSTLLSSCHARAPSASPLLSPRRLPSAAPLSALSPRRSSSSAAIDRIHLVGMLFHGRHGVYPAERELGQKFEVDVVLWLSLSRPAHSGLLADSVDYGAVYRCVRRVVEAEQFALLEELSWHVITEVLRDWPAVERISVRVKKPHVAVEGAVKYLGVEMERSRAQWQAESSKSTSRKRKKDITQLPVE